VDSGLGDNVRFYFDKLNNNIARYSVGKTPSASVISVQHYYYDTTTTTNNIITSTILIVVIVVLVVVLVAVVKVYVFYYSGGTRKRLTSLVLRENENVSILNAVRMLLKYLDIRMTIISIEQTKRTFLNIPLIGSRMKVIVLN
jgi:hypothetical protein